MTLLLLWRRNALSAAEEPDEGEVESLAAARSSFSSQMDAIFASTELVRAARAGFIHQPPAISFQPHWLLSPSALGR